MSTLYPRSVLQCVQNLEALTSTFTPCIGGNQNQGCGSISQLGGPGFGVVPLGAVGGSKRGS